MKYQIEILRQQSSSSSPYRQRLIFENDDTEMSVATLLKRINTDSALKDVDGKPIRRIEWECSCLQKKCGACAMRINGKPRLACDARMGEFKKGIIRLEPLKKFPVIADLMVDRSVMMENLKTLGLWLERDAHHTNKGEDTVYESSRCLQCGCCLEVCPHFIPGEEFLSAAAFVPAARVLAELPKNEKSDLLDSYRKSVYNGCGKSLSCRDICPAGIETDMLLVNNNAVAVWKRFFK